MLGAQCWQIILAVISFQPGLRTQSPLLVKQRNLGCFQGRGAEAGRPKDGPAPEECLLALGRHHHCDPRRLGCLHGRRDWQCPCTCKESPAGSSSEPSPGNLLQGPETRLSLTLYLDSNTPQGASPLINTYLCSWGLVHTHGDRWGQAARPAPSPALGLTPSRHHPVTATREPGSCGVMYKSH